MKIIYKLTTLFLVLIFLLTLTLNISKIVSASSSSDNIFACYDNKSGNMYRIKIPGLSSSCDKKDIEFSWQSEGSSSGSSSGWELVKGDVTIGSDTFGVLSCPSGKKAINGGYADVLSSGKVRLTTTPGMSTDGNAWELQGPSGGTFSAWVSCINQ